MNADQTFHPGLDKRPPSITTTAHLPSFRLASSLPITCAHEHVSILLGYITHLVEQGDLEDDHKLLGAATYLSALAKTLIDDVELTELPAP
ncbi:DUF3077 domain-containing protein [Pseudomonas sp.]|uniref:DUF3077 domain-containing protein n=1 Tax=Pseudomonas sp. TaxID=306 RepID=UPI0028A60659|nr:DUF3077 domain-containing protein [Pseudomonas sp.]